VPGIGPKTAAQLIGEYGDLETLLLRASEIKQDKRRQALIDNADQARLSKQLVTLDDRVQLEVPLADLAVHEPDYTRLVSFLKAMEFTTLVRRVAEACGIDASQIESDASVKAGAIPLRRDTETASAVSEEPAHEDAPVEPRAATSLPLRGGRMNRGNVAGAGAAASKAGDFSQTPQALVEACTQAARRDKVDRGRYEIVRDVPRLNEWVARGRELGLVAIDTETTTLDPMQATLCGFSLAVAPNEACYVPLAHRVGGEKGSLFAGNLAPDQIPESEAIGALKPLLEDRGVLKIGQNLKFDWQIFGLRGAELGPYDDTMLMSYVLDAGRSDHGLDPLSNRYFDHTTIDYNEVTKLGKSRITFEAVDIAKAAEYAAEDADVTLRLWHLLKPRLVAEGMTSVYETLERPLLAVLGRMERRGIAIDPQVLSRMSGEFAQRAGALEADIKKLAGGPLNPGSTKQVSDFLFGKLAWRVARKPKPALGQRRRPCSTNSQRRVTNFRSAFWIGARSPNSNRPIPTRFPDSSIPSPTGCTPLTRLRRPPPGGCRHPSPICKTFRSAPKKAAKSGAPSSPTPAPSSCQPTTRRSSCGSLPRSRIFPRSSRRSGTGSTSTP
jgi:DNA polymerase I - 3''-5'' exonuclease and polymerase domains